MPRRITQEEWVARVISFGHKPHGPHNGDAVKTTIECGGCGVIYETTPGCFKQHHNGCKDCSKKHSRAEHMKKHGVDHPGKRRDVREKTKATNIRKYGVDNPAKVKEHMEKQRRTMQERHGVSHPMESPVLREKQKQTLIDNYGVDNPLKSEAIKKKQQETCIKKYGVPNPMQNEEVYDKASKSGYKKREYKMPSGKVVMIQGFEHHAIDILFKLGYQEEDFIVGDRKKIPKITFWYKGKQHYFYPDIYIPAEKRILEVKSKFTYAKWQRKNVFKYFYTVASGYNRVLEL